MTTHEGHMFRDALRDALAARGMTPADLARATGVSGSAARNWARGDASPVAGNLPGIARALRATITTDGELWEFELAEESRDEQ